MAAELHTAWVWDCDACGRENFERAVEGDAHEAAAIIAEENTYGMLVAEEKNCEGEGEEMRCPSLIYRIAIAPQFVLCKHCSATFPTEVPTLEE